MKYPISLTLMVHNIKSIQISDLQYAEPPHSNTWRTIHLMDDTGEQHAISVHGDPEIKLPDTFSAKIIGDGLKDLAEDIEVLRDLPLLKREAD